MANERSAQKRVAIYLRVSTDEQTTENKNVRSRRSPRWLFMLKHIPRLHAQAS